MGINSRSFAAHQSISLSRLLRVAILFEVPYSAGKKDVVNEYVSKRKAFLPNIPHYGRRIQEGLPFLSRVLSILEDLLDGVFREVWAIIVLDRLK